MSVDVYIWIKSSNVDSKRSLEYWHDQGISS